jgi:hypothetical protein
MQKQVCIMIECDNNRLIFTNKKNLNYILEFAKNFNLKLHYAKTDSTNIVGLEKVAKYFCDQTYKSPEQYKIIKKNIGSKRDTRKIITSKAHQIRDKMAAFIAKKGTVTFQEIQKKFEKENISTSALSNHFTQVRHDLGQKGVHVKKIKNGFYEVQTVSKKLRS